MLMLILHSQVVITPSHFYFFLGVMRENKVVPLYGIVKIGFQLRVR